MVDHLVSWLSRRFEHVVQVLCTKTIVWFIVRVVGWCTALPALVSLSCRSSCLPACSYAYAARAYYPWDTDSSSLWSLGSVNVNGSSTWLVKSFLDKLYSSSLSSSLWESCIHQLHGWSDQLMERPTCYYRAFNIYCALYTIYSIFIWCGIYQIKI